MKRLLTLLMIISISGLQTLSCASAVSNKTIKRAYAKALENGTIKYKTINHDGSPADLQYAFYDFNWDGLKDLVLLSGDYLYAWTYKSGKVVKLLKKYEIDISSISFYCDKKSKRYWECFDGDGLTIYELKIKNKRLVKEASYYKNWGAGEKAFATKTVNGKTTKFSVSKFDRLFKTVYRKSHPKFKKITKKALIEMWK